MLAPRCTMFFERAGYGWTESHYFCGGGDLDTLQLHSLDLADVRATLLASDCALTWLRFSMDDTYRDSLVLPVGRLTSGFPPEIISPPAFESVNVRMDAGPPPHLYRSVKFLAGNPTEVDSALPEIKQYGRWFRRFEEYKRYLLAGLWGLKVQDQDPITNPVKRIQGLIVNGLGLRVRATNHGFQTGDRIHFASIRARQGVAPNGNNVVVSVFNDNVFYAQVKDPDFRWASAGRVRKHSWQLQPYSFIQIRGAGSRLRGHRYRPASWEVPGIPDFPKQPCGQIVDLLHSFYLAGMSFQADGSEPVVIRWYECADTAKPAPYGLWGSSAWHDVEADFAPVGENPKGHVWDQGHNLNGYPGTCHLGTDEEWGKPLTSLEQAERPPLPDCCVPIVIGGGVGVGGGTTFVRHTLESTGGIGLGGPELCPMQIVTDVCPVTLDGAVIHVIVQYQIAWLECWRIGRVVTCATDPDDCCEPQGDDDMLLVVSLENVDASSILSGVPVASDPTGTGFVKASATSMGTQAIGMLQATTLPTFAGNLQVGGTFTLADWSAVVDTATPSLSPRGTYFLSETAGKITLTPPTTPGSIVQVVGRAISPTQLELVDSDPILL